MAFYNNGAYTNPWSYGSGFGSQTAGFLQSSTHGMGPNETGPSSGCNRSNNGGATRYQPTFSKNNRRRNSQAAGQKQNQQHRQSQNPNGVAGQNNGYTPRRRKNKNKKQQPRTGPMNLGMNNGRRGYQAPIAPTAPQDGVVWMRDACAPIQAPCPIQDVVMEDAPPLLETRVEFLTRGAMAMHHIASAMLQVAGSTDVQMTGAPFCF